MPELILVLGGDLQVLEDAEPEATMILAINLVTEKSGRIDELDMLLADAREQRSTAEKQVSAHERTISQLSEQLEREGRAKVHAIARETALQQVIDGFQDKATDPEKK